MGYQIVCLSTKLDLNTIKASKYNYLIPGQDFLTALESNVYFLQISYFKLVRELCGRNLRILKYLHLSRLLVQCLRRAIPTHWNV